MNPAAGVNGDDLVAAAYDARSAEYIHLIGSVDQMDLDDIALIARWRDETQGALLDAGCGPGLWTAFLHDGEREAMGVDLSIEFVTAARARHPSLRFEVESMRDLPFPDGCFGGILAWYSLIHLLPEDLPAVLVELARVLAPGGQILIGFFDGEPGTEFAHAVAPAYFWSPRALEALLADAGLPVVHTERRDRRPDEVSTRPHGAIVAVR